MIPDGPAASSGLCCQDPRCALDPLRPARPAPRGQAQSCGHPRQKWAWPAPCCKAKRGQEGGNCFEKVYTGNLVCQKNPRVSRWQAQGQASLGDIGFVVGSYRHVLGPSPRFPGSPLSSSGGLSTLDHLTPPVPHSSVWRGGNRTFQRELYQQNKTKQEGTEAEEGDCMYWTGATYPAHFSEPVMSGGVTFPSSLSPALKLEAPSGHSSSRPLTPLDEAASWGRVGGRVRWEICLVIKSSPPAWLSPLRCPPAIPACSWARTRLPALCHFHSSVRQLLLGAQHE